MELPASIRALVSTRVSGTPLTPAHQRDLPTWYEPEATTKRRQAPPEADEPDRSMNARVARISRLLPSDALKAQPAANSAPSVPASAASGGDKTAQLREKQKKIAKMAQVLESRLGGSSSA